MAIPDELRKLVDPNNECCCEPCLSNKCKEWAYKRGFLIGSNCRQGITVIDINTHTVLNNFDVYIEDFTEFEIKACQWILENKETK